MIIEKLLGAEVLMISPYNSFHMGEAQKTTAVAINGRART